MSIYDTRDRNGAAIFTTELQRATGQSARKDQPNRVTKRQDQIELSTSFPPPPLCSFNAISHSLVCELTYGKFTRTVSESTFKV